MSISRSRRQIKKFYAEEMDRIGEFPTQQPPRNYYPPTDMQGALSYKDVSEQIERFALSIYRPSDYVVGQEAAQRLVKEKQEKHFNQQDRENFLIAMLKVNFLKRLESSAHSLTLTLDRTIGKIDDLLDKIERYEQQQTGQDTQADILPDEDEDDEEFLINRARNPYHLRELDLPRWKQDLMEDKNTLTAAWEQVKAITPERDGKLQALRQHIHEKDTESDDRQGRPSQPQAAGLHHLQGHG